jgi:hypothetical protein
VIEVPDGIEPSLIVGGVGCEAGSMETVLRFFQEDQWFTKKVEANLVRTGYRGERGTWVCFASVEEAPPRFLFVSSMGLNIPRPSRPAVMEYITRVNWGLPIGNFEMNLENGEVRFKTSIELSEIRLTLPMVRSLVYINVHTMDHYFPGVVSILTCRISPIAALAKIESLPSDNPRICFTPAY